jgi:protein-disulfide isomerase
MSVGKKIAEIVLIIFAVFAALFAVQVGLNVYKIKTGKLIPFEENISHLNGVAIKPPQIKTEEIINASAPYFGTKDPVLTIVEFGNFACHYSQEVSPTARAMMLKYKDKIKFIYRNFPLDDIYPDSSLLSLAGDCAAEQNNFWAMHDKMYQTASPSPSLLAAQIGLDAAKFNNCMTQKKYADAIARDFTDGYKNGVAGTPTFFFIKKDIAPIMIPGVIPQDVFEKIINQLIAK